jgi:hypothetical protein
MKVKAVCNNKEEIQGYSFRCPGCQRRHLVYTKEQSPGGAKWIFNGDLEKPNFTPSIFVNPKNHECYVPELHSCHSFIKEGKIEFLSDCTHALAGQTVELPEIN